MKLLGFYIGIFLVLSCNDAISEGRAEAALAPVIRSVADTSFTDLHLDSTALQDFAEVRDLQKNVEEDMLTFYRNRDFQFAWITGTGLHEKTQVFWELHNQYLMYTEDSTFYDRKLHGQIETILHDPETEWSPTPGELALLEMQLTEHFFHYAAYAYKGKTRPEDFNWNIPAKKIDAVSILDSMFAHGDDDPHFWEPVSPQYRQMRSALAKYHKLEKIPVLNTAIEPGEQRAYRVGDSSQVVSAIREKLNALGDFPDAGGSPVYDNELRQAVIKFQERHGLKADGIAGPQFFGAVNVPMEKRIQQLLINMERMRWLPRVTEGTRLVANIPSFTLHVYEGAKEVFNMDIVVGKAANRTVIFNDKLEYVVFSPYWNIPRSIIRKEILPAIRSNPGYLQSRNMEQTGYSNGLPVIRQRPGGSNALGKVKFIFPNRYSIYFHDTPAKSLFERGSRAFSHGCIRLKEPFRLAEYLLRNEPSWTDAKIREAMNSGNEKWVKLDKKVPVVISYFTAWVDDDGVQFRNDIYGHDDKMAKQLFKDDR